MIGYTPTNGALDGKYRKIVLEPQPFMLEVRLKGTRRRLSVSYEAIFELASKIEANRARAEKLARRKAR